MKQHPQTVLLPKKVPPRCSVDNLDPFRSPQSYRERRRQRPVFTPSSDAPPFAPEHGDAGAGIASVASFEVVPAVAQARRDLRHHYPNTQTRCKPTTPATRSFARSLGACPAPIPFLACRVAASAPRSQLEGWTMHPRPTHRPGPTHHPPPHSTPPAVSQNGLSLQEAEGDRRQAPRGPRLYVPAPARADPCSTRIPEPY